MDRKPGSRGKGLIFKRLVSAVCPIVITDKAVGLPGRNIPTKHAIPPLTPMPAATRAVLVSPVLGLSG